MVNTFIKLLTPLAKSYFLGFLNEKNIEKKLEDNLNKKNRRFANTNMGKSLGVGSKSFNDLPLTTYDFYQPYYENPLDGDFLYPLEEYLVTKTSGTMSTPKKYLIPKPAIKENMLITAFPIVILASHNGEKYTFEFGDVVYTNIPGGNHISTHNVEIGTKFSNSFVEQCPDSNLGFHEKVDYFVQNHDRINYAYMTVPTLLDTIYPQIGEPFELKGFMTQDSSAIVLKDKIKEATGNYPRVTFGSTESLATSLPSVEYPGCYFFDYRVAYPEFIPENKSVSIYDGNIDAPPEVLNLLQVEKGKRYQFVATTFKTEIHRYVMPDIMECVADGDGVIGIDWPIFKYYSRADKLVVLHNFTRIAEEEILHVLDNAGIAYADFVARRETEGSKDFLTVYIELSNPLPEAEVYEKIQQELLDFDKDWRDLNDYLEYKPLKLRLLPKGSFRNYLEKRGGLPKVDRINMRESALELLLSHG